MTQQQTCEGSIMYYFASQTAGEDEIVRLCTAHAEASGYGVDDYAGSVQNDSVQCDEYHEEKRNILNGCRIEYVGDVAFMRLPDIYAAPCAGGCNCGQKGCTGKWDTLAIPLTPRAGDENNNYSYTVHRPETSA